MTFNKGEIWWADLPDAVGSGPGFRHPVVIAQADNFNRSKIRTVIAAIVTSNTRLAAAPGNVFLSKRSSKLRSDSVINVSQLLTVDKSLLTERIGHLSAGEMQKFDAGLRLVLSLSH